MQNTYQDLITEVQSKNPQIHHKLEGAKKNQLSQVLLGVTGSGKTFTMAKVIQETNRPALILAPNKTLAAQLYGEMKSFFPENAVEYFVSYMIIILLKHTFQDLILILRKKHRLMNK